MGQYAEAKARKRDRDRAWAEKNRERLRAYKREWYAANREKHRAYQRDYYQRNKEQLRASRRLAKLRWRYKLTDEQLAELVRDPRCAICGSTSRLHIDHCHDSGRVRGLLCFKCNTALGWLDDDPARLRKAARYLSR